MRSRSKYLFCFVHHSNDSLTWSRPDHFINILRSNHLAFDQHSLAIMNCFQLSADKKISKHEQHMALIIYPLKTNLRKQDKEVEIKEVFFTACIQSYYLPKRETRLKSLRNWSIPCFNSDFRMGYPRSHMV